MMCSPYLKHYASLYNFRSTMIKTAWFFFLFCRIDKKTRQRIPFSHCPLYMRIPSCTAGNHDTSVFAKKGFWQMTFQKTFQCLAYIYFFFAEDVLAHNKVHSMANSLCAKIGTGKPKLLICRIGQYFPSQNEVQLQRWDGNERTRGISGKEKRRHNFDWNSPEVTFSVIAFVLLWQCLQSPPLR